MHEYAMPLVVVQLLPGFNGGMTVTMPMGLSNTIALRPRVAVVVMLGKVMGQLRGHSWVLQVASLRGLLIRVFGSEEVSEAIVVVGAVEGAGTVHDNCPHLWLLSSRHVGPQRSSRGRTARLFRVHVEANQAQIWA